MELQRQYNRSQQRDEKENEKKKKNLWVVCGFKRMFQASTCYASPYSFYQWIKVKRSRKKEKIVKTDETNHFLKNEMNKNRQIYLTSKNKIFILDAKFY